MSSPLVVSSSITIAAAELRWTAVRASGPGGQNVNKVSSKIELRFAFELSPSIPPPVKARLRALYPNRLDAEGQLVILSQLTRDRQRNLDDARAKLSAMILAASHQPKRRRATRPSRGATESRLRDKRAHAERKRDRHAKSGSD
jgi:ribosome-associated protein